MNPEIKERWQQFEALGETSVRKNLSSHVYGEENTLHAIAWLEHKFHERASKKAIELAAAQSKQAEAAFRSAEAAVRAADSAEQAVAEATRAADAAAEQALAAQTASRIAIGALLIATIAAVVALMQLAG
jgi:hypothetical protein